MNTQPQPTSNAHFSSQYRLDRKPDMSSQIAYGTSYNVALTRARDLDRYRTAYSSKTNIYDNSRTVSPANHFGTRLITPINQRQLFSPAGMDMVNSTVQSGAAFTKPFVRMFPQNSTFVRG